MGSGQAPGIRLLLNGSGLNLDATCLDLVHSIARQLTACGARYGMAAACIDGS